jgi:Icc-related predicted phosphoesterase
VTGPLGSSEPLAAPVAPVAPSPAPPALRILHVSDLHYSLPQLDWVVQAAPDFDLVVLSGDQLDISSPVPLDAQVAVILEYLSLLHRAGKVVVSSGNHDLTGPDANGEQAALWMDEVRAADIPTDGGSLLLDDTLVTVCPWWDGPIGREAVDRQLARDAARRPARWIWVYHWPPLGSPTCWTGRTHYGDPDVVGWIDEHRPDLVLTGHVHQPPFKPDGAWVDRIGGTWVFNPGRQTGPTPARIEIDVGYGDACWVSMMGREEVVLSAAQGPERTVF